MIYALKLACALLPLLALPAAAAPDPGASTEITDRYGRALRSYLDGAAASACAPVKLEAVSPWLVLATVATEDKRFFDSVP